MAPYQWLPSPGKRNRWEIWRPLRSNEHMSLGGGSVRDAGCGQAAADLIVRPQPACYRPMAAGALRTWAASGAMTCSASRYTPRRVLEENDRWNSRPR